MGEPAITASPMRQAQMGTGTAPSSPRNSRMSSFRCKRTAIARSVQASHSRRSSAAVGQSFMGKFTSRMMASTPRAASRGSGRQMARGAPDSTISPWWANTCPGAAMPSSVARTA